MTNLSKVMDIFSDILMKSRWEQRPNEGNFIPRIKKESPRPVPGTSAPHASRKDKPKGRKAGGTFITDDGGTDDATYVVGMMKERFGRQFSRAKKAAKSHQRDRGQSAMYARQESLLDAPSELEEMKERHGARMTGKLATDPRGKAEIKRHRRQSNKLLDRAAALQAKSPSTSRREKAMPKRGATRTYSTGKQPSWELRRGQRGGRNRSMGETTPTGTSGERGWKAMQEGRLSSPYKPYGSGSDKFPYRTGRSGWGRKPQQRARDKAKNIDRETINPNKPVSNMEKSDGAREAAKYQTRGKRKPSVMEQRKPVTPTPKDPNRVKRGKWEGGAWVEMLKAFGVPISKRHRTPDQLAPPGRASTLRQAPTKFKRGKAKTVLSAKKAAKIKAAEEDYEKRTGFPMGHPSYVPKPAMGFQPASTRGEVVDERGAKNKEYTDKKSTLGFKRAMLKAILKDIKGTAWTKNGLQQTSHRPQTMTEKSDGGERYSSGARGATPAIMGMKKAKKYVQRELPFSTEDMDHIAPTPDPHADTLPEPTRRGGSKQGSRREGEIPKQGWKEAALLWPPQPKENAKGRKVKTRVDDSIGGYPT